MLIICPGEDKLVNELREKENVEFLLNKTVQAIEGEMALQAVILQDKNSGKESRLEISGLFVAIGQMPENGRFFAPVARITAFAR